MSIRLTRTYFTLSILKLWISPPDHAPSAFQVTKHKAEFSHEAAAGAASFFAAREYEKHVEKNGHPANHAVAKELL